MIWDGISTTNKEYISGTLNSAGDCTVSIGSYLNKKTGWAVDGAFNLKLSDKYIHMLPERTTADSDHCVSAEWSGTTTLTITGRDGFAAFGVFLSPVLYEIAFESNGDDTTGTMSPMKDISYTATTTLRTNKFKRDGYVFSGWSLDSSDTEATFADAASVTGSDFDVDRDATNVTLYAVWTSASYGLDIDANGGTLADGTPEAGTCGTAFKVPKPTREGYTFKGWTLSGFNASTAKYGSTRAGCTTAVPSSGVVSATSAVWFLNLTAPDEDPVTLTAIWTPNTYKLSYATDGGTLNASNPTEATYGTAFLVYGPSASKLGYTFAGWELSNYSDSTAVYGTTRKVCTTTIPDDDFVAVTNGTSVYFNNLATTANKTVTLNAVWTEREATILVDGESVSITYETPYCVTALVSKVGCTFQGWTVANFNAETSRYGKDGACDTPFPADGVIKTTEDIWVKNLVATGKEKQVVFTPIWDGITYNIVYDLAGGTHGASHPERATFAAPKFLVSTPKRSGYEFAGWRVTGEYDPDTFYSETAESEDSRVVSLDGTTLSTHGDLYFRDMASKEGATVTLTALWTEIKMDITIDGESYTNACGEIITVKMPTKKGYTFDGWDVAGHDSAAKYGYATNTVTETIPSDGHIAATNTIYVKDLATTNNASVTFTPNWIANTYTIKYDANGGVYDETWPTNATFDAEDALLVRAPKRTGYTFTGWLVTNEFDSTTMVVTYEGADDALVVTPEGEVTKVEAVGDLYFRDMASKQGAVVCLTAQWENATTIVVIDGESYTNDYDTVIKIAAPEKAGWSFMGWTVTDFDPETAEYGLSEAACDTPFPADGVIKTTNDIWVKNLATGNEKQVVFTPIWEMNPSYGISYDEAGGTAGSSRPDYVEYSESVKISVPTRTGYTFTGWVISGFDPETACYGYNATCPSSVPSGGVLNVTRDFYVKCLSKNGSTVTFTAQWTNIAYKVSYDEAGGTAGSSRETSVDYDKVVAIDPPTRTGYTFKGWKFSGLGDGARYGTSAGSCNSTFPANGELDRSTTIYVKNLETEADATACFTAIWEGVTYSIDYDYDGGSVSKDNAASLVYGEAVRILAPKKSGFDFVGWYVYDACSDARWGLSATTCNQEIAVDANDVGFIPATGIIYLMNLCDSSSAVNTPFLVARWSDGSTAVVTFDANGGSVSPATKDYETGAKYGTLPTPTQEDKAFVGWFTAATGGSEVTATTTVEGTTTLYAHWTDLYTVAFKSNGGSGEMTAQKLPIGIATALATNAFTRTGYAFLGWAADSSATKADYADGAQVSALATTAGAEVDLYAVWQANTYTVVFDPNGGSGTMTSATATYDVPFTLPACTFTSPTKMSFSAWSFGGKTYAASAEVSNLTDEKDGSVTVKAVWTITLSDLSKAMDCTTLFWYSQDKTVATQWEVCEGEGYASTSCVTQENSVVRDRAPMAAELSGKETADEPNVKGTMTFWWKPASLSSQLQCGPAETADDYPGKTCRTVISAEGTNWQKVAVQVSYTTDKVGSANCYFVIDNVSPENLGTYECIDMVTWTPADTYPVPNAGDAVTGLSLSSHSSSSSPSTGGDSGGSGSDGSSSDSTASNDSLSLSFTADENFSYQVLRKESLTDREWTVEKTIEGVSGEQSVELPCNNSSGFYTIKTIQRTK